MRSATVTILSVFLLLLAALAGWEQLAARRGVARQEPDNAETAVRVRLQKSGITIQETFACKNRFEFTIVEEGPYTLVVDELVDDPVTKSALHSLIDSCRNSAPSTVQ